MSGNPSTSTCPSSSITFGRVFEGTSLFEVFDFVNCNDDVAFWSFVKPDQKPKTVAEAYINQDEDSEDEISDEEEEKEDMDVE